jgi:hypothetical protein
MDPLRRIIADGIHSVVDESSILANGNRRHINGVAGIVQADAPYLASNFPRRFARVAYLV